MSTSLTDQVVLAMIQNMSILLQDHARETRIMVLRAMIVDLQELLTRLEKD